MSHINFNCFECNAEFSVEKKHAGTEISCDECSFRQIVPEETIEQIEQKEDDEAINKIILTTAPTLEGYQITETLEVITAECAFGMNIIMDVFASFTDFFGGRSNSTQRILRDARKKCLYELKREAATLGADAVIAVDLDYSEFSGKGKSMLFLVTSGTAVKVRNLEP